MSETDFYFVLQSRTKNLMKRIYSRVGLLRKWTFPHFRLERFWRVSQKTRTLPVSVILYNSLAAGVQRCTLVPQSMSGRGCSIRRSSLHQKISLPNPQTQGMLLYFLIPSAHAETNHENTSCALKRAFDDVSSGFWIQKSRCCVFALLVTKWDKIKAVPPRSFFCSFFFSLKKKMFAFAS